MDKEFLYDMLRTPSVSGHEIALQKKVIQHMESVADEILTDATGDVTVSYTHLSYRPPDNGSMPAFHCPVPVISGWH